MKLDEVLKSAKISSTFLLNPLQSTQILNQVTYTQKLEVPVPYLPEYKPHLFPKCMGRKIVVRLIFAT